MKSVAAFVTFFIVCLMTVWSSGCLGPIGKEPVTPLPTPQVETTGAGGPVGVTGNAVVDANNRFALDAYGRLSKDPAYGKGNLFFSPFSISSALSITNEGARGTTADEIQSVFHFPKDDATRRGGFQQLYQGINQGNARYTLRTANALWAEQTYPFLPGYMQAAREYYSANATNMDFKTQAEASRLAINGWVEDQTNNRIRDLIPQGVIDSLTRLVITNAVYFKGMWGEQFDANRTKDDRFTTVPGTTVPVRMMTRTDTFSYMETDSVQVLGMPYASDGGKQLSMVVLLPKGNDLAPLEDSLTVQKLQELRNGLMNKTVEVHFPKFKLETKYSLPATLAAMGMPTAFTDRADFSGMDGTKSLYIGDVIHQAFVEVNEEGTEAAAATAVVVMVGMAMDHHEPPPIPVFRADHPFLFLIQDDDTGTILFLGRVMEPNG